MWFGKKILFLFLLLCFFGKGFKCYTRSLSLCLFTTLDILSSIYAESKEIVFCWVPNLVSIVKNEQSES